MRVRDCSISACVLTLRLVQKTVVFEELPHKRLGEVISLLVSGVDLDDDELVGVRPKPVPLVEEIAGPVGDTVVDCQVIGALIVFKDAGLNRAFRSTH